MTPTEPRTVELVVPGICCTECMQGVDLALRRAPGVQDLRILGAAEKVRVTGQKLSQKVYYRHSGYPGGLKSRTLAQQLALFPTRVIESAVRGMLPRNALGKAMLRKLHVYAGPDHPHRGQVEPGPSRVSSTGTPDSPPRETKPVAASTPVDASVEGEGASAGPEAKSPPRSARRASREQSAETDKELTS